MSKLGLIAKRVQMHVVIIDQPEQRVINARDYLDAIRKTDPGLQWVLLKAIKRGETELFTKHVKLPGAVLRAQQDGNNLTCQLGTTLGKGLVDFAVARNEAEGERLWSTFMETRGLKGFVMPEGAWVVIDPRGMNEFAAEYPKNKELAARLAWEFASIWCGEDGEMLDQLRIVN